MSTLPLQGPKFQAFDSNGFPLAGGQLFSYAAGTLTPQATFTTYAGNIANSNPIILNANGEADVWLTPGILYKFILEDVNSVVQWTVDNFPAGAQSTPGTSGAAIAVNPGGRLTLTSGTPVTTSDVTGASTIIYTPYLHDQVSLFDGVATWTQYTFTELSQALSDNTKSPAATVANKNYDLFLWNDSGTLRISRGPPWQTDTSQGTGPGTTQITQKDGRFVNAVNISNGPLAMTGLYLGTIRTSNSNLANDALAFRYVWNNYNRVPRGMFVTDGTNQWGYTLAAFRQANGNAANKLDFVIGSTSSGGEAVTASVLGVAFHGNTDLGFYSVGVGIDGVTNVALMASGLKHIDANEHVLTADWIGFPGPGRHQLFWLEASDPNGSGSTTTWFGTNALSEFKQTGIRGLLYA